jgi:putative ABC transport system permease protein
MAPFRDIFMPLGIPLPWRQLSSSPGRFLAALTGITFSSMLMIFQMSIHSAFLDGKVLRPIRSLDADLVLVSRDSLYLYEMSSFPRTRLGQAARLPEVAEACAVYLNFCDWRNPRTLVRHSAVVFGVEPGHPGFTFLEQGRALEVLKEEDAVLYDRATPSSFGPVQERVGAKGHMRAELAGKQVQVRGLFTMGSTLTCDCHLVAGTQAFFRLFPMRNPGQIDLGLVRLRPGSDPQAVRARLEQILPADVECFTKASFAAREQRHWADRTALGDVILPMVLVSLLTGAVVVAQILYTDVSEHLPEYAALKALGWTDRLLFRLLLGEALQLHLLGFAMSCALAWGISAVVRSCQDLPLRMSPGTLGLIFLATGVMCVTAGLIAARRLRSADPADIF